MNVSLLEKIEKELSDLSIKDQLYLVEKIIHKIRDNNPPLVEEQRNNEYPDAFKRGCLKGKITISDDFDEPLEDFKDYMWWNIC